MGGKLENLKFFTMFTLFDPDAIVNAEASVIPSLFSLAFIAAVLYIGGIMIFNKKDLPI